jgi:hypothetical protein
MTSVPRSFKAVLNLAAVLSLWSTSALAAKITLAPWGDDPAHGIVAIEGDLVSGDDVKFRAQVGRLTKAIVVFNSDGGNLLAGIQIGKTIRLKSFATAVLDGSRCASACAFAWLGGSLRFMERGAQIGFHAAYIDSAGRASESGVGNALLGSYLTQIGLSENAVVYITQAAPTELTWLNLRDAKQIGIEVLPFEPPPSTQKRDAQVHIQVQVIEDLQLREQPDPRARNILGAPPNDRMAKGSQVVVIDTAEHGWVRAEVRRMPTTSGARCSTRATAAGRTRTISRTVVNASLA